jgi:hypothetical protein
MGRLSIVVAAIIAIVMAGSLAWNVEAQTLRGVTSIKAATENFTPIQKAACDGVTGVHGCGPGWFWRFGRRGWACYRC